MVHFPFVDTEARIPETSHVHNWPLCEEDFLSLGKSGILTEINGRLFQLCCSQPCRAQVLLCGFNKGAPVLVLEPCVNCRLVSQPEGSSCSSWWAYGVVLTALFTPARSSFSSIYPFPFPAVRFCLAWCSDALTLAEEDFLRATVASSTHMIAEFHW